MFTAYECRLVFTYLVNAVRHLQRCTSETKALFEWVLEKSDLLRPGSSLVDLCQERAGWKKSKGSRSKDQSDDLHEQFINGVQGGVRRVRANRFALRLCGLGREMRLTPADVAILEIMIQYRSNLIIELLVDASFERGRHFRRMMNIFNVRCSPIPYFLGMSGTTFLARFESDAPLVQTGLNSINEDGEVSVVDR